MTLLLRKVACAFAALALLCASVALAAVPIHGANRVHFVGDSITVQGWFSAPGGFVDQVNAALSPSSIVVTSSGGNSNRVTDVSTDMANRVFSFNPDVVIVELGVNDVSLGTDPAGLAIQVASVLSQTAAWKPGTPVLWVLPMVIGEQWESTTSAAGRATGPTGKVASGATGVAHATPGPAWGPNVYDGQFPQVLAAISSSCASGGATTVDVRGQALTYESIHNTPATGVAAGVLTADGTHPNDAGRVLMGTRAFAQCAVSP